MPPGGGRDVEDLFAELLEGKRGEQQIQSVTSPVTEPQSSQDRTSYSIEPPATTEPQVSHERLNVSASESSLPAPEDKETPSPTKEESKRTTRKPEEIASEDLDKQTVRSQIIFVRRPLEDAETRAPSFSGVVFEKNGPDSKKKMRR